MKLNNRAKGLKFVHPLTVLALQWLSLVEFSNEETKRTKTRAQAIRLSNSKYSINEIAEICHSTRRTVSRWISQWEKDGFDSLIEQRRPGRNPIIPPDRHDEVINIIKESPKQIKMAINKIEEIFGKTISAKTLKRIIKKNFTGAEGVNL